MTKKHCIFVIPQILFDDMDRITVEAIHDYTGCSTSDSSVLREDVFGVTITAGYISLSNMNSCDSMNNFQKWLS